MRYSVTVKRNEGYEDIEVRCKDFRKYESNLDICEPDKKTSTGHSISRIIIPDKTIDHITITELDNE